VKGYDKEVGLTAIFKKFKKQQELKEKKTEKADHKTKLKIINLLFPKLSYAFYTEKN
jgi:hypothetical protein